MHIVIVLVVTCVVNIELVGTQTSANPDSTENAHTEEPEPTMDATLMLEKTFVVLIDIVFTDSSKRTCTGSIIHNNVVITAAHCFKLENKPYVKPEFTISFVVIGTKKMFESNYEQYLPIERVLTHPLFSRWTADLSLVYTFAGMISDKPGTIIPLATEKTLKHVQANVTVLSWGGMEVVRPPYPQLESDKSSNLENCDSTNSEDFGGSEEVYKNKNKNMYINKNKKNKRTILFKHSKQRNRALETTPVYEGVLESKVSKKTKSIRSLNYEEKTLNGFLQHKSRPSSKLFSRYLSIEESKTDRPHHHHHQTVMFSFYETPPTYSEEQAVYDEKEEPKSFQSGLSHSGEVFNVKDQNTSMEETTKKIPTTLVENPDEILKKFANVLKYNHGDTLTPLKFNLKSYYKSGRRQIGSQNRLTEDIFEYVNVQACKKIVKAAMPSRYNITKSNDVVCYSSENHFITNEDSGAPAVSRGQLVAVMIGGAEVDGNRVNVGIRISCYCSWIANNIPNDGTHLECCYKCCNPKHKESFEDNTYKHRKNLVSVATTSAVVWE